MPKKKRMSPVENLPKWDENQLLELDYFYWAVIRPAEEEAEERRERRRQRKARQKAKALEKAQNPPPPFVFEELPEEAQMVQVIDAMIRRTHPIIRMGMGIWVNWGKCCAKNTLIWIGHIMAVKSGANFWRSTRRYFESNSPRLPILANHPPGCG